MTTNSNFCENHSLCALVSLEHSFFQMPTCDFYAIVSRRDFSRLDFCWDLGTSAMLYHVKTDGLISLQTYRNFFA